MAGTSALDEPRLRDDLSAALLRRVRQPGRRPGRGHAPICPAGHCGQLAFPRIEPAVTVLVESAARPDRCLSARTVAGQSRRRFSRVGTLIPAGQIASGESAAVK